MKIITWNCSGAFRKKISLLKNYDPDVFIIQECEDPMQVNYPEPLEYDHIWKGENKNKGICIFSKKKYAIEKMEWEETHHAKNLKWFLPVRLSNGLEIIGVWAHKNNAKCFFYIGQFWLYLQKNKARVNAHTIIAGDFNSNSIWDSWDIWWNHSDCVRELEELGLHSVYHQHYSEKQGDESQSTFYHRKNLDHCYHIDYIFAPKSLIEKGNDFMIDDFEQWKEYSDHVPLFWEVNIEN